MTQQFLVGSTTDSAGISGPPVGPSFLDIEKDFADAIGTNGFAQQRALVAESYIQKLGELAASLTPPVINPVFPQNLNAPAISTPQPPAILPIVYSAPPAPAPFTGVLNVSTDDFPTFDATAPQLTFPSAPTSPNLPLPASPSVDLNFTYPTVDVTLPTAPDLLSISVQQFNGVTFPTFDAESPVLNLAAPQVVAYVPGAPYTDALLSGLVGTLQDRLETGVNGRNTGLPSAIEDNIWNRGREREIRQLNNAVANLDLMERMGYALPSGAWIDARIKLETDLGYTLAGQSRDVATEQAKLEQANIQHAITTATTIESKLIDIANLAEQRRFDSAKYQTEAGVSIYNAGVQAFAARVNAYRATVEVFTAQIAGARAIVEVYTAQVAAEKLKVDVNLALVQEYKVRVDAALASIEVFKGEISLIQTRAQIENLKVSIYGEQVKAFGAQINVYTSQVEAYRASLQAEQTKEQIYGTQAQVYGTLVDATYKTITAKIEVFKGELAAKTEEFDAYKALVESEAENVKALAAANTSVADIYRAEVQGTSAYNEALVKEWESIISLQEKIAEVGVQAAQANGQLYLTAAGIATDAAKVGAQVEAQIAASALGAVTWATHRSRQDSRGFSQSDSFGQQKSESHQTVSSQANNTNANTSTSTSQSFAVSSSNSFSTVHQINSVE